MGLLEQWDVRNQERAERENERAVWPPGPPPAWARQAAKVQVAVTWLFFLWATTAVVVGAVRRDVAQVAVGAVSFMVWGLNLVVWRHARRD